MRRLLAAFALCCALTMSVYAGEIDCGRMSAPEEVSTSLTGDISCGVTQTVITFMLSLL